MAKSRKREAMPAAASDAGAPQYAGVTTAAASEQERIAERAYQKYVERGGRDGRDLDDWLEAERELARSDSPLEHALSERNLSVRDQ
jgi:hypothetical protein